MINIMQFYQLVSGDYEKTLQRFETKEHLLQELQSFDSKAKMDEIVLSSKDRQACYQAACDLLLLAENLGFDALATSTSHLVEQLHSGTQIPDALLLLKVEETYSKVIDGLHQLEKE